MRTAAIALLCFLCVPFSLAQEAQEPDEAPKGFISGVVLRADSNQPLAEVEIVLMPEDSPGKQTIAFSGADGTFSFANLKPDYYKLIVSKPRFVLNSPRLSKDGYRIRLDEAQRLTGVTIALLPGGVVTGKVLDEQGEPIVGSTVKLLLPDYGRAGTHLQAADSATTNDLGEYRIFGIPPGRYYLVAHPPEPRLGSYAAVQARSTTFLRMYYDNALYEREARSFRVIAGSETSIDFRLPKLRTATINLRLALPKNFSDASGYIGLVPADTSMVESLGYRSISGEPSGTFTGVIPGRYLIGGIVERSDGEQESFGLAAREIDVTEGLNEVHVPMTSFSSVLAGRMHFDNDSHPPADTLMIETVPLRGEFLILDEHTGSSQRIEHDGTIKLGMRTTLRITINIRATAAGWEDYYLKSVLVGGRETLTTGIQPTTHGGNIELFAASDGAALSGRVIDAEAKPVARSTVVALPDAAHRRTYSCVEYDETDTAGRFSIRGLCPGKYTVLALPPEAPEHIFWDPDFVSKHEQFGTPIELNSRDRKNLQLFAIVLQDD